MRHARDPSLPSLDTMPQVAAWARAPLYGGAALLALLALLALSGHAAALGEAVEAIDAHVPEGKPFQVKVTAPLGPGEPSAQVQVSCQPCGRTWASPTLTSGWSTTQTGQRYRILTFPSSVFPGSDGEPKWSANYTASMVGSLTARANVTVHLLDDWTQPDGTYDVTDAVTITVAGVPNRQLAYINISEWTRSGSLVPAANLRVQPSDGVARFPWRIPKEQAADMGCPPTARCRDFRVEVSAGSKREEATFHARPARLNATVVYVLDEAQGPGTLPVGETLTFNRTAALTIQADVRYLNGAPLLPADRTRAGNASLNGTLKLVVERVTIASGQLAPGATQVATLHARYTPHGWRAAWTVPKNLSATQAGADNPQYRVRLAAQDDAYGNHVPETNGTSFRVQPLVLHPRLLREPTPFVERLGNASAYLRIRYEDGSPFTNKSNQSAMHAKLIDGEGDSVYDASLLHLSNGTWTMWYKPSIKFRPLGFYKLRLQTVSDTDGNEVAATDTEYFEVVPASPRVELETRVGFEARNDTEGFARGDHVLVSATIRYADGSPYNASRLPEGRTRLAVNVSKLDERGVERGRDAFPLEAIDDEGRWAGEFPISELNDTNPLGPWVWRIDVHDTENPPNLNRSLHTRWVHGAGIGVQVIGQPEARVKAGDPATIHFLGRYANLTALDPVLAGNRLEVDVNPWKEGRAGAPVSRTKPVWSEDQREWVATWHTNRTTLVGDYVFTVLGQDVFGNLVQRTTSQAVTVYVDKLQRQVLRDPPEKVTRGEAVIVIFDGQEGDTGEPGKAAPRVELQKWNPVRNAWEKERSDVRDANASQDHVGRFQTDDTTNLGLYRFFLAGRNDQLASIVTPSRSFRLLPVEVERPWMPAAADITKDPVRKGTVLTVPLLRLDGDLAKGAGIYRGGVLLGNATALSRAGRFDVQWRTSFDLPDGAYDLVVRGRDVHNNTFASAPLRVELTGVELQAKVPAPPAAAIQRAERLGLRVLVQYPDQLLAKGGSFTARLATTEGLSEVPLEPQHGAWILNWTPPADAPLGRYHVSLDGDDGLGNRLNASDVFSFQLAEGVLKRSFTFQRNVANRTENVLWVLPADSNDTEMRFFLRDDSGTRRELPYTVSKTGDYVVTWRPAKGERLGRFTLQAEGADKDQNAVLADARSVLLRPAQVGVVFLESPEGRSLKPGQPGRWVFQLQYTDGTVVPADGGNVPNIAMLSGDRIVEPAPSVTIAGDRWVVTWTPVQGKHAGVYQLAVGGKDSLGNEIQLNFQQKVRIDEGPLKDILGVPGFEAALLPLGLAGAALVLRRRR